MNKKISFFIVTLILTLSGFNYIYAYSLEQDNCCEVNICDEHFDEIISRINLVYEELLSNHFYSNDDSSYLYEETIQIENTKYIVSLDFHKSNNNLNINPFSSICPHSDVIEIADSITKDPPDGLNCFTVTTKTHTVCVKCGFTVYDTTLVIYKAHIPDERTPLFVV